MVGNKPVIMEGSITEEAMILIDILIDSRPGTPMVTRGMKITLDRTSMWMKIDIMKDCLLVLYMSLGKIISKEKYRETSSVEHKKIEIRILHDRSGCGRKHATFDELERNRPTRDWNAQNERIDPHGSDLAHSYSESRSQKDD